MSSEEEKIDPNAQPVLPGTGAPSEPTPAAKREFKGYRDAIERIVAAFSLPAGTAPADVAEHVAKIAEDDKTVQWIATGDRMTAIRGRCMVIGAVSPTPNADGTYDWTLPVIGTTGAAKDLEVAKEIVKRLSVWP